VISGECVLLHFAANGDIALSASLWVSRRPPHVSGVCSFPWCSELAVPPHHPNFAFDTRTHLASHAVRRVRAASFRKERRHCALSASLWVSRRPPHVLGVCSFPGVQNSLCPPTTQTSPLTHEPTSLHTLSGECVLLHFTRNGDIARSRRRFG
jgi:hypothetical protein